MRNKVIYGYEIKDGKILAEESQCKTVVKIFDAYREGHSMSQIAQELNASGIPSPNGKTWVHTAVGNILGNSRYAGESPYPAMVSHEIFEQVQARRRESNERRESMKKSECEKPVYNGMVSCGECGGKYWRIHCNGKYAWTCSAHYTGKQNKNGKSCRNRRRIVDAEIQKAFTRLQNMVFDGTVKVKQPLTRNPRQLETWKSKYEEMLENAGSYEEKSLADVIFHITAEEYAQSRGAEDDIIKQAVTAAGRTAGFRPETFKRVVRKIIVTDAGLDFELVNRQIIKNL